jgi:hypothetical protein
MLRPRPEIILIGDEPGTAEVCREYGLRHSPELARSQHGTPLLKSVFDNGCRNAVNSVLAYVNADIILLNDFIISIGRVIEILHDKPFLLLGRRRNIQSIDINFEDTGWQEKVIRYVTASGRLDCACAMDYFVFSMDIDWQLPPFLLGRSAWDSYFCYRARKMRIPVIDASRAITAIHQKHGYDHLKAGNDLTMKNFEMRYNFKLLGFGRRYTTSDCDYELLRDGIRQKKYMYLRYLIGRLQEIELWLLYYLRDRFYPYSYPLFMFLKKTKKVFIFCFGLLRRTSKKLSWPCYNAKIEYNQKYADDSGS